MAKKRTRIAEHGKYAVEFNSLRTRYEVKRASLHYKGPGFTFETLKEAQTFRDERNKIYQENNI